MNTIFSILKGAGQYFCAMLRAINVSAFSVQLCWMAAGRAGSSFCGKNKKNDAEMCKSFDHIGNFEEWVFIEILVSTFGFEKFEKGPSKLAVV